MNPIANVKHIELIAPDTYSGAATLTGSVDTAGFEFATIVVDLSTNAASASFSAVMQHSDTNGSFTDIAGTGLVYAVPGTGVGLYAWNMDLRGANAYERYLNLSVDLGYSTTGAQKFTAYAILGSPSAGVYTAAGNGAVQYYNG